MYESKYSKYITKNDSRYATKEEIKESCARIRPMFVPEGCGVPLLWDNSVLYVDDSDAHYYIQGQTGSKKSRVVGTNLVHSIIKKGENAIINDPKGEFFSFQNCTKMNEKIYSHFVNIIFSLVLSHFQGTAEIKYYILANYFFTHILFIIYILQKNARFFPCKKAAKSHKNYCKISPKKILIFLRFAQTRIILEDTKSVKIKYNKDY